MQPNIILLVIDSFRADKCYGSNKTSKTPTIDSLIKNGVYFTQTIASAPQSVPALASLFTSCYPFEVLIQQGNRLKLNSIARTCVKTLKDHGYGTYSMIPEIISLSNIVKDFDAIKTYNSAYTMYQGVGEQIINNLISKKMKEPWIYYIHFLDTHGTASGVPDEFNDKKYGTNQYERMVSALDGWIGKIVQNISLKNTLLILTADHASDDGLYSDSITNTKKYTRIYEPNSILQNLFNIVQRSPSLFAPIRTKLKKYYLDRKERILKERTELAISQIEKQNLRPYEKRFLLNAVKTKSEVYDDRFRIPLVFVGYGITKPMIIQQQVRSIDIFPTIFEIIRLESLKEDSRGASLLPLIDGKQMEEQPAFITSATNWADSYSSHTIGMRTSQYKYFRHRNNPLSNVHLYDLKNDPLEENNIASDKPDVVQKMEKALMALLSYNAYHYKKSTDTENDDEKRKIEEELRKLGYIF